jgi:hypothetical protein
MNPAALLGTWLSKGAVSLQMHYKAPFTRLHANNEATAMVRVLQR